MTCARESAREALLRVIAINYYVKSYIDPKNIEKSP